MQQVTEQPVKVNLSKYFGFYQLGFLQDNKVDCVLVKEYDEKDKTLINSPSTELWSVRVATRSGPDFNLPSIIGADKNEAIKWIKYQSVESRYVFMYSNYFNIYRCGRIHIDKFRTLIEVKNGDFQDFKKTQPDLTIESSFGFSFVAKLDNGIICEKDKIMLIDLTNRLRDLYSEELDEDSSCLYEFDFAFGCYANKIGIVDDFETLRIIGMRSYTIK